MSARPGMRYLPAPSTMANVSGTSTSSRFPDAKHGPAGNEHRLIGNRDDFDGQAEGSQVTR